MNATSYEIDAARQLQPIAPEQVAEVRKQPDARVWLDLTGGAPDEIAGWLDRLEIHGIARKICLEAGDRAGFYPLRSEMILVMPVMIESETTAPPDHVAFFCRENLLLTVHQQPALTTQQYSSIEDSAEWLPERTIGNLVAAMLLDSTQDCLARTSTLRDAVSALEDRLDRTPDSVAADDILDLRSDLQVHETVVSEQLPPLQALHDTDRPGLQLGGARDYLNCALANLQAADRRIDRLDGRISEIRSGFQMHSQDKTNGRLGMLTILSAIFMPITLMAGIWGMNFEGMPELGLTYGYPLALGAMVAVAISMFLFFRRGGWFDTED